METSSGKSVFGLDQNMAAGLSYIPLGPFPVIWSIIVIATDKTSKLARFHAVQSLLLLGSAVVALVAIPIGWVILWVVSLIVYGVAAAINIPTLGYIAILLGYLGYLALLAYGLAVFAGWIISCIQAFRGKIFKFPLIGKMADTWSN